MMARSMLNAKAAQAAAARARMSKRAKRARWWKENKKRVTIASLGFLALVFLGLFTPWGPDYYYGGIQNRLMESPTRMAPNTIKDLYKLGVFYNFTLREDQAMEMYNEIAKYYYAFTFTEYSVDPESALERRYEAERRIKRQEAKGPPFEVPQNEIKYVALAIWRAGEILQKGGSRQFTYNIYKDLYLTEMIEDHPYAIDSGTKAIVEGYVQRREGRR